MYNDINFDVLCQLIADEMGGATTAKSVKRYLKATYRVILKQLKLKHRIAFKGFGYWEIKPRKSGEREIHNPLSGEKRLVYVKPKYSITFKPFINFDMSVNDNDFKILTDKGVKNFPKDKTVTTVDLINRANEKGKKKEDE